MFGGTKCAKCENSSFEIQTIEPAGSNFKFIAVQCRSCKAPFAATDFYNIGALLKDQEKKIDALTSHMANVDHVLRQVVQILNNR
jgi:predicted nucleic-acid-binding Zn-ribbon protein